ALVALPGLRRQSGSHWPRRPAGSATVQPGPPADRLPCCPSPFPARCGRGRRGGPSSGTRGRRRGAAADGTQRFAAPRGLPRSRPERSAGFGAALRRRICGPGGLRSKPGLYGRAAQRRPLLDGSRAALCDTPEEEGGGGGMDVGELLSYQPNRGTKRPREDDEDELKVRHKQAGARERGRHREEDVPAAEEADEEKKKLLQIMEKGEEEEEEDEPVDESSVKKMILTFEKRSYKNQELRIKFPDNPEKFMESELDLNDIIQEMHVIATMPDLYHLLVELNAVHSLLGLLGHDNTDILLVGQGASSPLRRHVGSPRPPPGAPGSLDPQNAALCKPGCLSRLWLRVGGAHLGSTAAEQPTVALALELPPDIVGSLSRLSCAESMDWVILRVPSSSVIPGVAPLELHGAPRREQKLALLNAPPHVSIAVVDLLQELTDIDTLHESEEGAEVLIDALVDGQVVALLVQNLERLDESVKEEADGVHNTLAIIENMAEFRPEMCSDAAQQGLVQWLLKRIKAKMPFDANKLYCSEVLAILLQNKDDNRELLGELDGIDVLLQQLSVFKRHNPSTAEEQEMMENLFDSLCSSLMLSSNRDRFLKGEGLQLMNLMLREKKISRSSALKVLDHAMIGPEGADNCHKFVDILGLRTIFPLFMKSPKKIKKVGTSEKEHEEHVCSILASLLRNLRGQQRTRLLSKFTENDSEKVDRLMELYFKYLDAMQAADKKIEGEKHVGLSPQVRPRPASLQDMVRRGEIIDDDMEDEFFLRRLDAGLFVLQLICYIMAEICNASIPQIRQRVHQILNMRGSSIKIVRHIIKEYAENIGEGRNPEYQESEQKRIVELLENF
ncbi:hypothetical protein lerEdw1_005042, partial [Lerista edwardsae]